MQVAIKQEPAPAVEENPLAGKVSYSNPEAALEQTSVRAAAAANNPQAATPAAAPQEVKKPQTYVKDKDDPFANVGRNDPCPCGSGLKYKKCHGRNA